MVGREPPRLVHRPQGTRCLGRDGTVLRPAPAARADGASGRLIGGERDEYPAKVDGRAAKTGSSYEVRGGVARQPSDLCERPEIHSGLSSLHVHPPTGALVSDSTSVPEATAARPAYIPGRRRLETRRNTGTLERSVLEPARAVAAFARRTTQNATRSYRVHAPASPGSARQDPTATVRDKYRYYCWLPEFFSSSRR